jgi:hypothetical protein
MYSLEPGSYSIESFYDNTIPILDTNGRTIGFYYQDVEQEIKYGKIQIEQGTETDIVNLQGTVVGKTNTNNLSHIIAIANPPSQLYKLTAQQRKIFGIYIRNNRLEIVGIAVLNQFNKVFGAVDTNLYAYMLDPENTRIIADHVKTPIKSTLKCVQGSGEEPQTGFTNVTDPKGRGIGRFRRIKTSDNKYKVKLTIVGLLKPSSNTSPNMLNIFDINANRLIKLPYNDDIPIEPFTSDNLLDLSDFNEVLIEVEETKVMGVVGKNFGGKNIGLVPVLLINNAPGILGRVNQLKADLFFATKNRSHVMQIGKAPVVDGDNTLVLLTLWIIEDSLLSQSNRHLHSQVFANQAVCSIFHGL